VPADDAGLPYDTEPNLQTKLGGIPENVPRPCATLVGKEVRLLPSVRSILPLGKLLAVGREPSSQGNSQEFKDNCHESRPNATYENIEFKRFFSGSSRRQEAHYSTRSAGRSEPPHVGCYGFETTSKGLRYDMAVPIRFQAAMCRDVHLCARDVHRMCTECAAMCTYVR